jgi:hypothetical protein
MPNVLIVAAGPFDQDPLRLGAEVKEIRNALNRSRNRQLWKIESNEASTVDDLRRALLDFSPTIVHFSGHGGGADGLCFETDEGATHFAKSDALSRLFHHFKATVKCVVLNACHSHSQMEAIRQEIDYVVGMKSEVEDSAARKFAAAFYDAVFAGADFRTAFELGCSALDLAGLRDVAVPVFATAVHLGQQNLAYSALIPKIEQVLHAYLNTPFMLRGRFTTTGDAVAPLLKRQYGEQTHRPTDRIRVLGIRNLSGENWQVDCEVSGPGRSLLGKSWQTTYYLRIHDANILIEWEASVGLWSVPVRTYLAMGSGDRVVARVEASLGTYYNYGFSDRQHLFQSVQIRDIDRESLHGYVRKGTAQYETLMELLVDGHDHRTTLELENVTGRPHQSVITRVLSPTWIYHPT